MVQGRTLQGTVALWDLSSQHLTAKHPYIGLSRATHGSLVRVYQYMERLQTIWEEAGRPGAAKFKAAALLEGVRISRDQADEFVKKTGCLAGVSKTAAKL